MAADVWGVIPARRRWRQMTSWVVRKQGGTGVWVLSLGMAEGETSSTPFSGEDAIRMAGKQTVDDQLGSNPPGARRAPVTFAGVHPPTFAAP